MASVAERPAPPAMRALRWLLYPRRRELRHRLVQLWSTGRPQLFALIGLTAVFWAGVFYLFHRVLGYFLSFAEFGSILTYKLLSMVLVVFFSVLLFSNVITALSTYYLSEDLDRMVAAPVPGHLFFYGRFIDTVIESSWMILMFAVPAFLAYGVAHAAGPIFYLVAAFSLVPFTVIPAAVGVAVTSVLVNVFPARRARDVLVLLAMVAFAVVYLVLRFLRPERLLHPETSAGFAQFLAEIGAPTSVFLPTTWATEVLHGAIVGELRVVVLYLVVLSSTAAALTVVSELLTTRLFLSGWSKAQQGRKARLGGQAWWERAVWWLTTPLARQTRLLVIKELRTFVRDSSQWSQLVLLFALVVVYVYNFRVIPMGNEALVTFYFRNVVAFFNLALAAFVIAAVAVRFVFPAISLEGRSLWILRSSPLQPARLWWSKFGVALLPLSVLGQVLVVATSYYLEVTPLMAWLSSLTLLLITPAMVALGLAIGATYPKFEAVNAAKVAAGTGGLVYMILCMLFIGAVVLLEAWPVYLIFMHRLYEVSLSAGEVTAIAASFSMAAALALAILIFSVRVGVRRLASLEV